MTIIYFANALGFSTVMSPVLHGIKSTQGGVVGELDFIRLVSDVVIVDLLQAVVQLIEVSYDLLVRVHYIGYTAAHLIIIPVVASISVGFARHTPLDVTVPAGDIPFGIR